VSCGKNQAKIEKGEFINNYTTGRKLSKSTAFCNDTELQRSSWMYCSDGVDDENSIVSEESNKRNDESELLEKSRTGNGGKLVWAADDAF